MTENRMEYNPSKHTPDVAEVFRLGHQLATNRRGCPGRSMPPEIPVSNKQLQQMCADVVPGQTPQNNGGSGWLELAGPKQTMTTWRPASGRTIWPALHMLACLFSSLFYNRQGEG
jgi:hypothetical protein